jgi:SET domain-containing protein
LFQGIDFGDDVDVLPLGYGAMYNHSDNENVTYYMDRLTNKMLFFTIRDIAAGEELYVNYGDEWWSTRNLKPKT